MKSVMQILRFYLVGQIFKIAKYCAHIWNQYGNKMSTNMPKVWFSGS